MMDFNVKGLNKSGYLKPFCKFVQTYKMQRLLLLILVSFFFMASCHKSDQRGILSEKQMIELLTEVHLIDGYLNTLPIDSSRKVINALYEQVFAKYRIDSATFQQNVLYYLGNPVASKELYASITTKLQGFERELHQEDSIRTAFVTDSVRRVNYYLKLEEESRRLIFEYPKDTLPYDYYDAFPKLMDAFNIGVNKPQPTPSELPSPPETSSSSEMLHEESRQPLPERADTADRPAKPLKPLQIQPQ